MIAEPPDNPPRLLIVDDEEPLRFLFTMALEGGDYQSEEAANGRQALELLKAKHFDLVLLDLSMPGLSGLDVLERMRRRGDMTQVTVVSAYIPGSAVLKASARGVTNFLGKPMTLEFLRSAVANGLKPNGEDLVSRAHREASQLNFAGAVEHLKSSSSSRDGAEGVWLELYQGLAEGKSLEELSYLESRLERLVTKY